MGADTRYRAGTCHFKVLVVTDSQGKDRSVQTHAIKVLLVGASTRKTSTHLKTSTFNKVADECLTVSIKMNNCTLCTRLGFNWKDLKF